MYEVYGLFECIYPWIGLLFADIFSQLSMEVLLVSLKGLNLTYFSGFKINLLCNFFGSKLHYSFFANTLLNKISSH